MRHIMLLVCLIPGLSLAQISVSGRWIVKADVFGNPIYLSMDLNQDGEKLTGNLMGADLEGTLRGSTLRFSARAGQDAREEVEGTVERDTISGTVVFPNPADPGVPVKHRFTAARLSSRRPGSPQRHDFHPATFYRQFSALNSPVLTVFPGDTIHTTTVDAGGVDEHGVSRALGGNPETGPFYVETAAPGDTLVVHLTRVRLNRDWAQSDDFMVPRALDSGLAVTMKDVGKSVRWHLDLEHGIAISGMPGEHLSRYSVPLRPMLGCIGVAPPPAAGTPDTGDSGRYGGNMDFNEIVEGATVYLPVFVPGALLYVGDGHAAMGDGELNGNALETSMDVEFTLDVIPAKRIPGPRVESTSHIMAMGLAGSLDDAFRAATANMAQWLADDYRLAPSEVAQVLGTSAEYKVSEVADRSAGVALMINKERLLPMKSLAAPSK